MREIVKALLYGALREALIRFLSWYTETYTGPVPHGKEACGSLVEGWLKDQGL